MAESQLPKAESIFQAIVDLPPDQQESVLAQRCGDDAELRALVERLLANHDRGTASCREPGPLDSTVRSESHESLPPRIGHYEILCKIGEGGMGTVYEARQESPRRTVAVKVVRRDITGTSLWKRFQFEAQILGQLNHPGIAQVHEAGTADDGTPFFAMEYVRGLPLLEYAERHQLDSRERLVLTARICEAVQHAHEKGVIHRDLKPGNILVTESERGSPQPKILDFGVARAVHSALQPASLHTRTGQLVGTLAYMSPEQVGGHPEELDKRSDVYQLGVILYELLCGKRPYELEDLPITEAARIIQEREPASVSSLDTSLRGDVEIVVAKALEKERDRRYATAAALAEDIRHCLADEPIVARPASAFYRLGKTARRNRVALLSIVGALGFAVVTVAVGLNMGWLSGSERGQGETKDTEPSMALVDVRNLSTPEDPFPSAIMTNLLEVGLIEASPLRVVSLEYLKDLRRRMFGDVQGPIGPSEALEIARAAGASSLLFCDVTDLEGRRVLLWRLVDTKSGEALGARRVEASEFAALADSAITGVLPVLARASGSVVAPSPSVTELTTASPEAYRHYLEGKLAKDKLLYRDASRKLSRAIEIDSTFALAYLELAGTGLWGVADRRIECIGQAWTYRDRLGAKDRLRLDGLRARFGETPAEQEESLEIYREILSRWPDDRDAIVELGDMLGQLWKDRDYKERFALAQHGVSLYPDDRRMFELYETGLSSTGRADESIAAVRDFMGRHPEEADMVANIGGTFLYSMAEPDSAERYFEQALAVGTNNGWYLDALVQCAYMRGDVEEAIRRTELRLEPRPWLGALAITRNTPCLAHLHAEIGRIEKAFDLTEQAEQLATTPHQKTDLWIARDELRLRTARAQEVIDDVGEPFYEDYRTTRIFRAWALAAVGSVDAAIALVDSLKGEPGASEAWWAYYVKKADAEIALAQGDPSRALTLLLPERVSLYMIDLDRRDAIVRAYRMAGHLREAEENLREILRWYGGHALAHYELGQVLAETGHVGEAAAEYERFLEMWSDADEGLPQLVDARQRLASLKARSTQ